MQQSFNNKNILITGATGLICSHLVQYLMENTSAKVFALGRSKKKLEEVFANYLGERLVCIEQDVSNPLNVDERLHYIFHAAGPIDSKTINERPVDVISPNIKGLFNCCELVNEQMKHGDKCRLIVFSSVTVYSSMGDSDVRLNEADITCTDHLNLDSACYSQSKRFAETIARSMYRQYDMDIITVRFAYVYGESYFKPNTAFYQFIDLINSGNNIVMNNSDLPRRDNIYVDDALSGLILAALEGEKGESYNISSNADGENFAAIDEMAGVMMQIINEKNKTNLRVEYKNKAEKRTPGMIFDNTKLKKLGWRPEVSLQEGIRQVLIPKK